MEQYSNAFKQNFVASTRTVVLDYLFGEHGRIIGYQLVRFAEGEPWNVLFDGFLLGSLTKIDGIWVSANGENLDSGRITAIGKFIDSQHFNLLPDKIKIHWEEQVQEVVMENDSSYMIICKEGIEFDRFRLIFSSFVSELIEEEWPINFKVYNAAFSDDFEIEIL